MFHTRGPAAAKHRSPTLLFDRRTTHVAVSVDRSRRVLSWQSSARYAGAWPVRHWKTRTAILKVTRWRTDSQWSCRRIGVMWPRCVSRIIFERSDLRPRYMACNSPWRSLGKVQRSKSLVNSSRKQDNFSDSLRVWFRFVVEYIGYNVHVRRDSVGSIAFGTYTEVVYLLSNKNASVSISVESSCFRRYSGNIQVSSWILLLRPGSGVVMHSDSFVDFGAI